MGDPKKPKKKFKGPTHPWQAERIEIEKGVLRDYGLLRKKEIWKANTIMQNFKVQVKKTIASPTKQSEIEGQALLTKLRRLGIISESAGMDDVLGLTVQAVLERRLQTILVRKNFALSMKQARQFILHGHITIDGRKLTSPSYLVSLDEESKIGYAVKSPLADAAHPEREKKPTARKRKEENTDGKFGKRSRQRSFRPRQARK